MATIGVNQNKWKALSDKQQLYVKDALVQAGVLQADDTVEADEAANMIAFDPGQVLMPRDMTNKDVQTCWKEAEMVYAACIASGQNTLVSSRIACEAFCG